jgi:hypothetical protein
MVDRYNSYGRLLEDIEPDGDAYFVRFDAYQDLASALRNLLQETSGDDETERVAARKLLGLRDGVATPTFSGRDRSGAGSIQR